MDLFALGIGVETHVAWLSPDPHPRLRMLALSLTYTFNTSTPMTL